MSYSIIYGAQFIKGTNNGTEVFLPIVLIGSNNVYEATGTGRKRSRDFTNLTYYTGGAICATKETILQGVENSRLSCISSNEHYIQDNPDWDVYSDARYGWFASLCLAGKHSTQTSFQSFKNVFVNGIKNAVTVEQLVAIGVQPRIYTSYHAGEQLSKAGLQPLQLTPKTTAELFEMLESTKIYTNSKITIYVDFKGDENTLKRIKAEYYPTPKKAKTQPKEVNEYYSILFDNGYYFRQLTARRLKFGSKEFGKKFTTKAQAQKVVDKVKGRFSTKVIDIETTVLEEPILL